MSLLKWVHLIDVYLLIDYFGKLLIPLICKKYKIFKKKNFQKKLVVFFLFP